MMIRLLKSLAAATGLVLAPLTSDARILVLPVCGGARHIVLVPLDPAIPGGDGDHWGKACHAVADRRSKEPGMKRSCG